MRKNSLLWVFLVTLAFVGSAFADYANGMYFYVKQTSDGALHLTQSEIADPNCSPVKGCLSASFTDAVSANEWLVEMLNNRWSNGKTLVFDSDIDFGGFSGATADGTCDAQFASLPFPEGGVVNGNGKTVKNLCYVHDVADGAMVEPVGLFSQNVDAGSVTNLNFENVRIIVGDSRKAANKDLDKDGSLFYPVGALLGYAKDVTIENVTLKNVYIKAPFAGGVVGFANRVAMTEITAIENIEIENDVDLNVGQVSYGGWGIAASNYAGVNMIENWQPAVFPSEYSVFLGGLAGITKNTSISKSEVNAKISDLSSLDTRSALGGFVGLVSAEDGDFKYNENTLSVIQQSPGKAVLTEISGGRAMGGLFGEVVNMHLSTEGFVGGIFEIEGARVDSLKITKAGSDSVAAGGIVGTYKSSMNGRLEINKSVAHVNIEDEVESEGPFNYFAGGLLGATNTCGISYGRPGVSGYVSIVNSNVYGNVHVISSGKAPSAKVNAFLGGVGGFVCFTADGSALNNDTSSVVVKSDVTTSSDSIFVGGFVGLADIYIPDEVLVVSDLVFKGQVSAQVTENRVRLGGIFGAFLQSQASQVSFENVYVKNEKTPVVKLASDGISKKSSVAYVGGVCGNCSNVKEISFASVVGDIVSDDKNFAGDSLVIGGLLGNYYSNLDVKVMNTYSIGNISVASASKAIAGYLIGHVTVSSDMSLEFSHNFHYSDSDKVDAFGYISNGADITSTWKTNSNGGKEKEIFSYNIRNGSVTNLSQNGKNGTKKNEEMQNANFAALMNEGLEEDVWSQDDELNNKLPFFGKPPVNPEQPETPVYTVKFMNGNVELLSVNVEEGEMPEYTGDEPTKTSTAEYSYTFDTWSPTIVEAYENAVYEAQFTAEKRVYSVKFMDGDRVLQESEVEYGVLPTCDSPTKAATTQYTYTFSGWTPSVEEVEGDAVYQAVFNSKVNSYKISFVDGEKIIQEKDFDYGTTPVCDFEPTRDTTAQYTFTFKGWDKERVPVTGVAVYQAVFDTTVNTFDVVFISHEGDTLSKQKVPYGGAAQAPTDVKCDKHEFVRWDKAFDSVVGTLVVTAIAADIAKSSSSVVSSSSEEPATSSSRNVIASSSSAKQSSDSKGSSSSEEPATSSSEVSSSSSAPVEPKSSSSRGNQVEKPLEIAKADIEYSGRNAIRLNYVANIPNPDRKTSLRVKVVGEKGVYMDTLLFDSLTKNVVQGDWQLAPAPIGSYDVFLTMQNTADSVTAKNSFEVDNQIIVPSRYWLMVSLAAFDEGSLKKDEDAAYYWWDEVNPMGDYWQYRMFEFNEAPEATRGYWFGSSKRDTLVLKAEAPTNDTKIVWKLENRYSGWNMVANPHGWRIDLANGKGGDVEFWRWNAASGEYEIPSTIGPYEAVWAHVSEPTTWEVSTQPVFDTKAVDSKPLAKMSAKSDWCLRAILADESGKKDSWNFLGVGDTSGNIDEPPAGQGDHVTLSIVEGKAHLAKSVKPESDEYSWTLLASATSSRNARLSFEGAGDLSAQGMALYVTANGRTQVVRGSDPVELSLGTKPTQVNVRVAKGALAVANGKLEGFRAAGHDGCVQVSFDAAKNLSGARAVVQLVALDGTIVSMDSFTASYGTNSVALKAPKCGMYFVRVKLASQSASGKVLVK